MRQGPHGFGMKIATDVVGRVFIDELVEGGAAQGSGQLQVLDILVTLGGKR
jgi:hypothetical protein